MSLNLFAQITKVDEAKRIVIGRAVQEVHDRSDEIFDYASSKPHFEDWSKNAAADTGGKSLGNLRAMHGKVAAGKLTAINFNDADKAIDISAKVVDDNEWKKVLEGVYTGFSIGGSYVDGSRKTEKSSSGKDITRYTAVPAEISLVDSPCIPTAKFFDIVKADGAVEKHEFKPAVAESIEIPGTPEQVDEFCKALLAAKFTLKDAIEAVGSLVTKRAEKPVVKTEEEQLMEKAIAIGALVKRVIDPDLPLTDLADIAKTELTAEERTPLKTLDDVRKAIVDKVSKGMSAGDKDRLQAAHDHLAHMGAACGAGKSDSSGDMQKINVAALIERITKLEAQPAPHVVLRAVEKIVGNDPDPKTDPVKSSPVLKEYPEGHLVKFQRHDGSIDFDAADRALVKTAA